MKILVVDDTEFQGKLLGQLLADKNLSVASAENGEEALEKINKETFDLVLSDMNMPVLDGFGLINQLRKIKNPIPFLMFSSRPVQQDLIDLALRSGVDKYIGKTVMTGVVEEVLNFIKNKGHEISTAGSV